MKKKNNANSYGIIGLGRFGMALVECLASAGKEVIAIDKDETRVREARRFTEMALVVDNLEQMTLEEAGIQNCEVVAICIGEQIDVSILATMTVLKMGVGHVIAKATSFIHGEALKQLGASVVYPERDMAIRLGKGLLYNSFLDSIALSGNAEVRRIQVSQKLIGTTIQDMNIRRRYGVNIIAVEHDGHTDVNFAAEYCFREGDVISVVGQIKNLEHFEKDIQ